MAIEVILNVCLHGPVSQLHQGNTNNVGSPVLNLFSPSIVAVKLRIEPTMWIGGVALRIELLGCRL